MIELGGLFSFIAVFLVFNWVGLGDVNWFPWFLFITGLGAYISALLFQKFFSLGHGKKMSAYFAGVWFYIYFIFSYWALHKAATNSFIPEQQMVLQFFSSQGFICFLVLSLFSFTLFNKIKKSVYWGLMACGLFHAVNLFLGNLFLDTGVDQIGLLGNRSLGASFTVIWLSLIPRYSQYKFWESNRFTDKIATWWWYIVGILAVITSKSSISYLALGGMCGAYFFKYAWDYLGRFGAICIAFVLIIFSFLTLGFIDPEVFLVSSRAEQWPIFYTEWLHSNSKLFGFGPGSMQFYLPLWQKQLGLLHGGTRENTFWLWVHNDWFQLLLEYGLVGLGVFVSLWIMCLKQAWSKPSLFASVIAIGIIMFGNYPWHIAATTLICTFILWECITLKETHA